MATLSQLNIYPIKSTAGIAINSATVEIQGLAFDRRFLIADHKGNMITGRGSPQLLGITTTLHQNGLTLNHPKKPPLTLSHSGFAMANAHSQVWSDQFQAYTTTPEANHWISDILEAPAQLLYCGEQSRRIGGEIQTPLSFADAYPALLISEASLEALNLRSPRKNTMAQFRPNLVATHCESFAEDGWKKIKIADVIFEVSKPCERCIMTTIHPDTKTNDFDKQQEPLATLSQFRANKEGGVFFGQNLKPLNEGRISNGDPIEIIETQTKAVYYNRETPAPSAQPTATPKTQPINISINGQNFSGNNQDTLLSQAEAAGIPLPFKCRVGRCGTCKSTLIHGDINQADNRALKPLDIREKKILPCCCIPQSDIELSNP